jgi:hypothetical protein
MKRMGSVPAQSSWRQGSGLNAAITLPGKLTGIFVFGGKSWPLSPGINNANTP